MRFKKKPVVIEAEQFDPEKLPLPFQTPDGVCHYDGEWHIHTLEGRMSLTPGDWVIRGVKGDYYPCKPDIFAMTYEPADGES